MEFEQKVKSMTGKQILGAMINGLNNQLVSIDMTVYGCVKNGICYGCAATNAIFQISGKTPNEEAFYGSEDTFNGVKPKYINSSNEFLEGFERAIDWLRKGNIGRYNNYASSYGFSTLIEPQNTLPWLGNEDWEENLKIYEDYYNSLP